MKRIIAGAIFALPLIATSLSKPATAQEVMVNPDTRLGDRGYEMAQLNVNIPLWVGQPVYSDRGRYYWQDSQHRRHSIPQEDFRRYSNRYHWNGRNYGYYNNHDDHNNRYDRR